jgi:hypothetical protein
MRILVTILLDTLPMLGNVLLLCFVLFSIFGIIGVQLWKGVLRNRCYLDLNAKLLNGIETSKVNDFYQPESGNFICSEPGTGGMTTCADIPVYENKSLDCNYTIETNCLNSYYTKCSRSDKDPLNGVISFDNFGYAFLTIFQVINLEDWSIVMYYLQDSHSFWDWIYFIFLILVIFFFFFTLLRFQMSNFFKNIF